MRTIDLVLHDWFNLTPEERQTAIKDIHALAATFATATPHGAGRRARAMNIVASLLHFLEEGRS